MTLTYRHIFRINDSIDRKEGELCTFIVTFVYVKFREFTREIKFIMAVKD
jgi:hypothetical protein